MSTPRTGWSDARFLLPGHLLFLGLLVLSLKHYRERVVHVDSAFQVFKWVQGDAVEVEAHRYPAVPPQLAVKAAKAAGAGLPALLRTASAAHVLVGWLVFALAAHLWRAPWSAAACALAAVLCTRLTFYGMVLEANYLLCYPFLLAAVLEGGEVKGRWPLAFLALALTLLVHPVGFLIALYVLAFFHLAVPALRRPLRVLAGAAVLWGLVGRVVFPPSEYESGLYASALEGLAQAGSIAHLPSFDFLVGHTWRHTTLYLPAWLLLALLLGLLARRRAWPLFALVALGCAGYLLLNMLTYHTGETAVMQEKNFLPLAVLIALPLLFEVARLAPRWRAIAVVPFTLVLFLGFRTVSFASRPAGERLAAIEGLVRDARAAGVRKGLVPAHELHRRGIGVRWALPFETLLASSLDGPEGSITLVAAEDVPPPGAVPVVLLQPWTTDLRAFQLDRRYFALPEGPYGRFPVEAH